MFNKQLSRLTKAPKRDVTQLKGLALNSTFSAMPVFIILFFGLFFFVIVMSMSKIDKTFELVDKGVDTQATVHSIKTQDNRVGCGRLYYEFTTENGLKYVGDSTIPLNAIACELLKGDKVTVVYLPQTPSVSNIASNVDVNRPPIEVFLLMPLFFLLVFSPGFFPGISRILKHRKLYKTGTWVQGNLIYIKEGKGQFIPGMSAPSATLYFEFCTADGTMVETQIVFKNTWLLNNLQSDQTLNVIYQPTKPTNAFVVEVYIR
jgi:hypothetical protein